MTTCRCFTITCSTPYQRIYFEIRYFPAILEENYFSLLRKLKTNVQVLKHQKGALKALLESEVNKERICSRCRRNLGWVVNKGASCRACKFKVCKKCQNFDNHITEWICCVCQKNVKSQTSTENLLILINQSNKRRDEKYSLPANDVIKKTIIQSWTISNPLVTIWTKTRNQIGMKTCNNTLLHLNMEDSVFFQKKVNNIKIEDLYQLNKITKQRKKTIIMKAKPKSLNVSEKLNEEEQGKESIRINSEKKAKYRSQKLKTKIKRQPSLEEYFSSEFEEEFVAKKEEKKVKCEKEEEEKNHEKKFNFLEFKTRKIEFGKSSVEETFKEMTDYTTTLPHSSKLRERFSRSKYLKDDSKHLNVELSKSPDSGIGVFKSTEDDLTKISDSGLFKIFDIAMETRQNKSDSERSPNFLETVTFLERSRSHERSVSSDSSNKNLSDVDKPKAKAQKRHEYSESRDSSSSYEGNLFDAHISNRVRKLHEVALKQMSEESAKSQQLKTHKHSVNFKYPVEFSSSDNLPTKVPLFSKIRKFKSLEKTDSQNRASVDSNDKNLESQSKEKTRSRKHERNDKRINIKDKRYSCFDKDFGTAASDRKKEKRCKGFLKNRRRVEEENDENIVEHSDLKENNHETSEEFLKRLSRKDKTILKKVKRALSEEQRANSKEKFLLSPTGKRSDSENRQGRRKKSEGDNSNEPAASNKIENIVTSANSQLEYKSQKISNVKNTLNSTWETPKKLFSAQKCRADFLTTKLDVDRNKALDFVDFGSYLEVVGKIWPIPDEYKIVFISSDSSTRENRSGSTDSDSGSIESEKFEPNAFKKVASDCDWDYFESSSIGRSLINNSSHYASPKSFNGNILERVSPAISTSDDNSPKFSRRSYSRLLAKDYLSSNDNDASNFSSNLKKLFSGSDLELDESAQTKKKSVDITNLKVFSPTKNKNNLVVEESSENNVGGGAEIFTYDIKHSEGIKKPKKRKKNRKLKKGNSKSNDVVIVFEESKNSFYKSKGSEKKPTESSSDNSCEREDIQDKSSLLDCNFVKQTNEERKEIEFNKNNVTLDDIKTENLLIIDSFKKFAPLLSVAKSVCPDSEIKNSSPKIKIKSKKQKNKKKSDKRRNNSENRSEIKGKELSHKFVLSTTKNTFDQISDEFIFQKGNFGFRSPNFITPQTQYPDLVSYKCPISTILQNTNVFQNFIPIPVPVPIPVFFPVPTAIWAQNYQNFFFSNFNFASENFNFFNSFQNLNSTNYSNQNIRNSTINDIKEMPFKIKENTINGTGNSSMHVRPINMQRPAFTIEPFPGLSHGSVNLVDSNLTCQPSHVLQLPDNEPNLLTKKTVVKSDESQLVFLDKEKSTKCSRTKKLKKKCQNIMIKNDFGEISENGSDNCEITSKENFKNLNIMDSENSESDKLWMDWSNIFVQGKTFRDVKNILKNKNDSSLMNFDDFDKIKSENSCEINLKDTTDKVFKPYDNKRIIFIDDSLTFEKIDNYLLNIDKKSESSSTSLSENSDNESEKKPFKKTYYFNGVDDEKKTSDGSDISCLSSSESTNSSSSEKKDNPDSKFSEIYILTPTKSEFDFKNVANNLTKKTCSEAKKKLKKIKEMLPQSSNGTNSSNEESSVVLLKHVKKIQENDEAFPQVNFDTQISKKSESKISGTMEKNVLNPNTEILETTNTKTFFEGNIDKSENLHNDKNAGEQPETKSQVPVNLVENLTESDFACASVVESETSPKSVPVTILDNNSKPVFDKINSDSCESVSVKLVKNSSDVKKLETDYRILGNYAGIENECLKNLNDVICSSRSEVIIGDLPNELESRYDVLTNGEKLDFAKGSISLKNSFDSVKVKSKHYGLSLLDKIENRIRHFSQHLTGNSSPQGNENKYTSLIMITQDKNDILKLGNNLDKSENVKVITNNTTKVIASENVEQFNDVISLRHTNKKYEVGDFDNHKIKSLEGYYTMTLENSRGSTISPKKPNIIKNMTTLKEEDENEANLKEKVQVVSDDKTLSAVICLEEGLADDDSWVEDLEKDRENDFSSTLIENSSSDEETVIGTCIPIHTDREEDLRGYHRGAMNFTLHTIVEESCEDSEVEDKTKSTATKKKRPTSATDLEKYFYFNIGGGVMSSFENQDIDTFSESSSSIYSDGEVIDDNNGEARENSDQNQLSTSRLEKYFLNFDRDGREKESDGSVGSDSEGSSSPEQRKKRLFRARASNRLHSSSLDNLVQSESEQQTIDITLDSEDSSTEADVPDLQNIDKSDESVKRKKKRKISGGCSSVPLVIQEGNDKKVVVDEDGMKEIRDSLTREHRQRELREYVKEGHESENLKTCNFENESDEEKCKTPQAGCDMVPDMIRDQQQSRDSGFIGSCDDLLKDQKIGGDSSGSDTKKNYDIMTIPSNGKEIKNATCTANRQQSSNMVNSIPPSTNLTRKDSFNNWSSDEETNLMMTKMRQFFKAMVSVPKTSNKISENSNISGHQNKSKGLKPPQLVYFENELTRLMKTVPGIRDDQVREIVEYLSSEDTWSDSYDSSDYTSSDLEGTAAYYQRSQLQQEISESCKQIIDNFDQSQSTDQEQKPKVLPRRNSSPINRETAFVYQKLLASFNKITNENENSSSIPQRSPPLFAKVMHHIGSRLVALMHEVSSNSSGEGSMNSHKSRYHKRLSQKLSNVSSTTEEDCGLTDESDHKIENVTTLSGQNLPYFQLVHQLPRSKSHDLLLEEAKVKSLRSSNSAVNDIAEEKEASDYERFSWRGSFESALMADSRSKLTLLSSESHSSNIALATKRRSAGDLLFLKSLSREQLDRVRSCGSIGGVAIEDKNIWTSSHERNRRRRSSVPDAASGSGASADGDEDSSESEIVEERSITLPRSLLSVVSSQNTNSLPRLPTTGGTNTQNLTKAHSVLHFLPNAKSVRYRPPGFSRVMTSSPKRTVSAPGLQVQQPSHARRDRRRNQNFPSGNPSLSVDELNILDSSTTFIHGGSKSASPSPVVGSAKSRLRRGASSVESSDWSTTDEIQRLVSLEQQRQSNFSLGARSESMASVYSGAGEGRSCSISVKGEVEFGLQYNYKAGDLEIYVKQCKDLAAIDAKRNRSDPYVKVYLLPDKSKSGKRKTKVKKHTLNPIFDEVLKFHIPLNGLEFRTLWLTVWHSDMFGRNDFLGEVMMSLENKVFDDPTPQSYVLQERTEPFEDILSYKGEIIVGLKFVPPDASTLQKKGKRSKGSLNVKVKEAKNLTAVKNNGSSDPFCKSYLLPDKGRNSKQKTPVQKRTCNPSWNHTFVYEDVSLQELSERCLELTVWDHDRLASNEFLGGLRFNLGTGKHYGKTVDWMDSTAKEVSLWQSMLEKPNLWVEGSLPLRTSLDSSTGTL